MLPRTERLTTREFACAFSNGAVVRHPLLQLRLYRRPVVETGDSTKNQAATSAVEASQEANLGEGTLNTQSVKSVVEATALRAAFVVPKKIGKATVRNRLRRRVREVYRLSSWRTDGRFHGCDMVFLLSPPALEASTVEIEAALEQLRDRAAQQLRGKGHPSGPRSNRRHEAAQRPAAKGE